jgi:hypothetical protein
MNAIERKHGGAAAGRQILDEKRRRRSSPRPVRVVILAHEKSPELIIAEFAAWRKSAAVASPPERQIEGRARDPRIGQARQRFPTSSSFGGCAENSRPAAEAARGNP